MNAWEYLGRGLMASNSLEMFRTAVKPVGDDSEMMIAYRA